MPTNTSVAEREETSVAGKRRIVEMWNVVYDGLLTVKEPFCVPNILPGGPRLEIFWEARTAGDLEYGVCRRETIEHRSREPEGEQGITDASEPEARLGRGQVSPSAVGYAAESLTSSPVSAY